MALPRTRRAYLLAGAVAAASCVFGRSLGQENEEAIASLPGTNSITDGFMPKTEELFWKDPITQLKNKVLGTILVGSTGKSATVGKILLKTELDKTELDKTELDKTKLDKLDKTPAEYLNTCHVLARFRDNPSNDRSFSLLVRTPNVPVVPNPRECEGVVECECPWIGGSTVSTDSKCFADESCAFLYDSNDGSWDYYEYNAATSDRYLGSPTKPFNYPSGEKPWDKNRKQKSGSPKDEVATTGVRPMRVTLTPGPDEDDIFFDLIPDVLVFKEPTAIPSWTDSNQFSCDPTATWTYKSDSYTAGALCNMVFISNDAVGTGCKVNGVKECAIFFATLHPDAQEPAWIYRQDTDEASAYSYFVAEGGEPYEYGSVWETSTTPGPVVKAAYFIFQGCNACPPEE